MLKQNSKKDITETKLWKFWDRYGLMHFVLSPICGAILCSIAESPSKHPIIFYAGIACVFSWFVFGLIYATFFNGTERRKLLRMLKLNRELVEYLECERQQTLLRIHSQSDSVTAYRTRSIPYPKPEGLKIDRVPESRIHEIERLSELDDEISEVKRVLH